MINFNANKFLILFLIVAASSCYAATFGEVAQNLYEPVTFIIELLRAVSILCGAGLCLGGFFRYLDYRRNPIAVRLSMVVFMFIFGVALIIVGFIPTSSVM